MLSLPKQPNPIVTIDSTHLKPWTVAEYHRLGELGFLNDCERTELIAGQIWLMVAKGTPHVLTLRLLTTQLTSLLSDRPVFISNQDPILLDDFSEPEPDLAIIKGTIFDYTEHHPQPSDIYLVVEVADSTLKQDCEIKDKLYARANILEYWVVDLKNRQINIFRHPTPMGYTDRVILSEPNEFSPQAFPNLILSLTDILPPIYPNYESSTTS
jgi:Uma2 family endonuclease